MQEKSKIFKKCPDKEFEILRAECEEVSACPDGCGKSIVNALKRTHWLLSPMRLIMIGNHYIFDDINNPDYYNNEWIGGTRGKKY